MDQLIPDLAQLVAPLRDCFRSEVFQTFRARIDGGILSNRLRTIREPWPATRQAAEQH